MDFVYKRKINYYETDKMGIVHHSNYIRFLEECRCIWLEELGMPMAEFEKQGVTIPTLEVNCKYKHHVTAGDVIVIRPIMAEFNGVRMTVEYEVINEANGEVIIEASTKHCFTNMQLRPVNLKKHNEVFFNKFKGLL